MSYSGHYPRLSRGRPGFDSPHRRCFALPICAFSLLARRALTPSLTARCRVARGEGRGARGVRSTSAAAAARRRRRSKRHSPRRCLTAQNRWLCVQPPRSAREHSTFAVQLGRILVPVSAKRAANPLPTCTTLCGATAGEEARSCTSSVHVSTQERWARVSRTCGKAAAPLLEEQV